jgi:type I restriction enzyme S subunit
VIRDIGLLIWPKMTLSDLAIEVRESYQPSANEALPYVGLEHIEQDSLQLSAIGTSTDTRSTKRRFRKGDVLFGTLRPYFRKVVKARFDGVCSTDIRVLRARNPSDSDYLLYFIADRPFIDFATATSNGTRMPRANWELLSQCKWRIPPACSRRKIAAILSAYDDLIENNRRRIEILEEMAQALYREWFVEFRFPGHEAVRMVDSPLGKIPEGWEVRRLGDVAAVNRSSISPKDAPDWIHYVDISSVSPGRIDTVEEIPFEDAPSRARRQVQDGDIVWSSVRPNRRSYSLILDPEPNMIVSTGFTVLTPVEVSPWFLYQAVTTDEFVAYLTNHATGAAYPAVSAGDFENAPMLIPCPHLVQCFGDFAMPVLVLKKALLCRNKSLRRTRDLLLPRLISGELDVSDLDIAG